VDAQGTTANQPDAATSTPAHFMLFRSSATVKLKALHRISTASHRSSDYITSR
jgi:hypothetical protein